MYCFLFGYRFSDWGSGPYKVRNANDPLNVEFSLEQAKVMGKDRIITKTLFEVVMQGLTG